MLKNDDGSGASALQIQIALMFGKGKGRGGGRGGYLQFLDYCRIGLLSIVKDGDNSISKGSRVKRDGDVPLPCFECSSTACTSDPVSRQSQ